MKQQKLEGITDMPTPAPGSRWVRRNGVHAGSEVVIDHTSDVSVFVVNQGGGDNWGNQKNDDSKINRITLEQFASQYVPAGSLPNGDAHGGGVGFRRYAAPKPKQETTVTQPLAANGIIMTGGTKLNLEIMEITPDLARTWLSRGGLNREPTKGRIARLAAAIRRGEWQLTGDSIKLDSEGRVRDGKHRLTAVIEAGVPIQTLVVRNVDEAAFVVLNTGKNRTVGDVMGMAGFQNRIAVASVARGLTLIDASGRYDPGARKEYNPLLTHAALLHYAQSHPEVVEGVLLANHVRSAKLAGGSGLLGALFALLWRVDREAASFFAAGLTSGANLAPDSPILKFRNRLIVERRMPNGPADREHLLALGIKSWNAWRAGENLKQLTWHGSHELHPEPFPVPV